MSNPHVSGPPPGAPDLTERPVTIARSCLALGAVGALLVGVPAHAATRVTPVCNLVVDPKGDDGLTTSGPPGVSEGAFDLVSADVAADAKRLTVAFRVAKLAPPQTAPNGYSYVFEFHAPGTSNALYVRYYTGSPAFAAAVEYGYDDATQGLTPLGQGVLAVDRAKNQLRITVPLDGFTEQTKIRVGMRLSGLSAATSRDLGVVLVYADTAASRRTYAVGAPSCVTPVR